MATFKAEVSPYKKKDGTYNVRVRIYHNELKRYVETNLFLSKDDLTKSGKIKNIEYLDIIENIERGCRNKCNEYAVVLGGMSVDGIVEIVENIIKGDISERKFDLDFIKFGRECIEKYKNADKLIKKRGIGKAANYEIALNNLQKFICTDNISIHKITSKFVQSWIDWILKQPAPKNREKGNRAVSLYPGLIRALHNRAKEQYNDEDEGVINIPLSPFAKIKLPAFQPSKKRALSAEKIKKLFDLEYQDVENNRTANRYNQAKDVFILSFCLLGINSIDLFFCDKIVDDRLIYQRIKTYKRRSDNAEMSIKIEPEISHLFDKYRDKTGERVFNFYQMYNNSRNFNRALNIALKKIGESIGEDNLEFYAARHSWGTIARNKCGIPKDDIHEFLNHASDNEMKVTDMYIEKDYSIQDAANRKIIDYIINYSN